MISRLWPVLPLLVAVSERLTTKKEERLVSTSDMGKMVQGAVILSVQAAANLFSSK